MSSCTTVTALQLHYNSTEKELLQYTDLLFVYLILPEYLPVFENVLICKQAFYSFKEKTVC